MDDSRIPDARIVQNQAPSGGSASIHSSHSCFVYALYSLCSLRRGGIVGRRKQPASGASASSSHMEPLDVAVLTGINAKSRGQMRSLLRSEHRTLGLPRGRTTSIAKDMPPPPLCNRVVGDWKSPVQPCQCNLWPAWKDKTMQAGLRSQIMEYLAPPMHVWSRTKHPALSALCLVQRRRLGERRRWPCLNYRLWRPGECRRRRRQLPRGCCEDIV